MKDEEEMFKKVFGEVVEEALTETSEDGVGARARKVEAVLNKKEAEEHNFDHAVFRIWCPHCAKGRAEVCGHKKREGDGGDAPTVSLDYICMRSEQEKEEENGMPIIVVKDNTTKTLMAKVVPTKGANEYAVEAVRKLAEQFG